MNKGLRFGLGLIIMRVCVACPRLVLHIKVAWRARPSVHSSSTSTLTTAVLKGSFSLSLLPHLPLVLDTNPTSDRQNTTPC